MCGRIGKTEGFPGVRYPGPATSKKKNHLRWFFSIFVNVGSGGYEFDLSGREFVAFEAEEDGLDFWPLRVEKLIILG